jgi:hypothetical protein
MLCIGSCIIMHSGKINGAYKYKLFNTFIAFALIVEDGFSGL